MLQRMVANLLDNAIKYTRTSGNVDLALSCSGDERLILTVSDSGIGILPEDLPHIFERFFPSDQTRSEAGTGLGLSLARAVANAHSGRIDVESRHGNGTTFTVVLPVRAQVPAGQADASD